MEELGFHQPLRTGEVLIIVVVLFMWAGESGFWVLSLTLEAPRTLTKPTTSKGKGLGDVQERVKFLSPACGSTGWGG